MTRERLDRMLYVLDEMQKDVEQDVRAFEGRPFNGRTVSEYFGNQAACIATLAKMMRTVLEETEPEATP